MCVSVSWPDGSVSNGGVGNSFHPQTGTVTCTLWPKEVDPSSGGVGNSFHPQTRPTTCLRWLRRQTEKFVFRIGTVLNNEAPPLPSHRRLELKPCSSPHRPSALPPRGHAADRATPQPFLSLPAHLHFLLHGHAADPATPQPVLSLSAYLHFLLPGHAADRATPQPLSRHTVGRATPQPLLLPQPSCLDTP